jgi:hypothetical protein
VPTFLARIEHARAVIDEEIKAEANEKRAASRTTIADSIAEGFANVNPGWAW